MLTANTDSFWLRIIYIVSVIISGAVAFLILGPRPVGIEGSLRCICSANPKCNFKWNNDYSINCWI